MIVHMICSSNGPMKKMKKKPPPKKGPKKQPFLFVCSNNGSMDGLHGSLLLLARGSRQHVNFSPRKKLARL
jgi:hypothetical protein